VFFLGRIMVLIFVHGGLIVREVQSFGKAVISYA
jgi:hypothetical protein